MAKSQGVPGWHSMRKEQLVKALLKADSSTKRSTRSGKANGSRKSPANGVKSNGVKSRKKASAGSASATGKANGTARSRRRSATKVESRQKESRIAKKIRLERQRAENMKNLALVSSLERENNEPMHDRVIAIVRDSYWIQAYWEISRQTVARAKVALSEEWHNTRPVLRLLEVVREGTANMAENVVREIPIHGGVRNWYIDVTDPPKTFRVAIGYAAENGKFHLIAKSNAVTTPAPSTGGFDLNWTDISDDYQKYYGLSGGYGQQRQDDLQDVFEEKLRRPMNQPEFVRMGNGVGDLEVLAFEVDAHMVIQGTADPTANVTLAGEPIRLEHDGSFCVKLNLPDRRQVLPIVASSRDGTQQRTTVLAIERNTKVMEPVSREYEEL